MYVCLKRLDNNRTILWAADCVLLCSHSATYWEWHVSLHGSYTVQFDLCNEGHSAAAEGIVNNKSRPLRDAFNMANYFGGICHLRTIKRIRIRSWHPFWGAKCVNVYSRRRSSIHSNYKGHAQLSLLGQQHCFNSVKGQGLFEIRRTAAASWENFFYSSLEMQFKKKCFKSNTFTIENAVTRVGGVMFQDRLCPWLVAFGHLTWQCSFSQDACL